MFKILLYNFLCSLVLFKYTERLAKPQISYMCTLFFFNHLSERLNYIRCFKQCSKCWEFSLNKEGFVPHMICVIFRSDGFRSRSGFIFVHSRGFSLISTRPQTEIIPRWPRACPSVVWLRTQISGTQIDPRPSSFV